MMVQRDGLFDCIKGGLILLVVLGHSIVYSFPDEYLTRWDFKLIYSFHMPFFILVSGYLVEASKKERGWKWLWRRSSRLMLPYCTWSAIAKAFSVAFMQFFSKSYEGLADVYWFLIVLFLCDITYVLIGFVRKRNYGFVLYSVALFIGICILGGWIDSFWHIFKLYVLYMPFYFFGVIFFRYKEKVERVLLVGAPLFFLMYIIMLGGFDVGEHRALYTFVHLWYPGVTYGGLVAIATLYNRIVLFFGVLVWYLVFKKVYILADRRDAGRLSFLGKRTMPIYLMHSFFFVACGFSGFVNVIVGACLGIGGALLIYYIVKRYRGIRILLFGEF